MRENRRLFAYINKDALIMEQVRRRGEVVYGSQSLRFQIGPFARQPNDWDILSKKPGKSAKILQKRLDSEAGGDYYFVRRAGHTGTYKVKEVGPDNKKNTDDDLPVADYTQLGRRRRIILQTPIGRLLSLKDTLRAKENTLSKDKYEYRWEKDSEDVSRIKFFKKHILLEPDD